MFTAMPNSAEHIEDIKREIDLANDKVWNQRAVIKFDYDPQVLIKEAHEKAIAIDYRFGIARCLLNEAMGAFILQHNYELSEKLSREAYKMFEELGDEKWKSNTLITEAIIKNTTGAPESALYLGLKGIDYYEDHKEDTDVPMAYYVMGTIYKDLKKFDQAEKYFKIGVEHNRNYNSWSGRLLTGLSNIYSELGRNEEAIALALQSLEILRKESNIIGESRVLNDIGAIYKREGDHVRALEYMRQALELRRKHSVKQFILGSLVDLSILLLERGDVQGTLAYCEEAEQLALETDMPTRLVAIYGLMADCYKREGNFEKAVSIYEKLLKVTNELIKLEKDAKVTQLESKLIKEKEQEIERLRNVELKSAYDLIAEKNKEILDSIHYAKRIQNALLASHQLLKEHLNDHFIVFKPKDIVSGDFYWATSVGTGAHQRFYLAVCDSTGHGVPGAFMSLLNITFLNEAVNEKRISEPGKIFDHVRSRLIENISKEGQKDGFDGILICLEKANGVIKRISYAAANNAPLIIKRNANNGLDHLECSCDPMPVGLGERTNNFNTFEIPLAEATMLYLPTDGYADQFGGPKGKKLKYKPFYELLKNTSEKDTALQARELESYFDTWKGSLEQVDDVCLAGIRII